jgi:hypothetical protein
MAAFSRGCDPSKRVIIASKVKQLRPNGVLGCGIARRSDGIQHLASAINIARRNESLRIGNRVSPNMDDSTCDANQ